jgi:tetratricopeptide (TPR) repeat protein
MGRSTIAGALAVLWITCGVARAAEGDRVAEAQRHYEAGMASYHLEEYDKAISEWEAGYRAKPAPQFLYNIAQAYRLSRRPDKALSFYQKYLKLDPNAANRPEVERHITALTAIVDSQKRAAERPSTQPIPLQGSTTPSGTTSPDATATTATTSAGGGADLTASAPRHDKPIYKKGWFWGAVAGGAVLVAGAVTLGVVLGGKSSTNEQALPPATFN